MKKRGRESNREYRVDLRFYSKKLSPKDISTILGVLPSDTQWAGAGRGLGKKFEENMCSYESNCSRSLPLEKHITSLLKKFASKKDAIISLSDKANVVFWCACFSSNPETTLALSPETLAQMASIQAEFCVSVYPVSGKSE